MLTSTPSLIANYFVEVCPGEALGEKIGRAKEEFIALLWPQIIDNPAFARFFRDDPHFTMMCARTGNLPALLKALEQVATEFSDFPYEIVGTEYELKSRLREFHTKVDEPTKITFDLIHAHVLQSSFPYNTAGLYELFSPEAFAENLTAKANLLDVWFPFSNVGPNQLFKPHASVGRLHPKFMDTSGNVPAPEGRETEFYEMRPAILDLLERYQHYFNGTYRTDGMKLRQLPFNSEEARLAALSWAEGGVVDPKATPYNPVHFAFAK